MTGCQAKKKFHNMWLGHAVDAEEAMKVASKEGYWVVLQNISLVQMWPPLLKRDVEHQSECAHRDYRLFRSTDPVPDAASYIPPIILEMPYF